MQQSILIKLQGVLFDHAARAEYGNRALYRFLHKLDPGSGYVRFILVVVKRHDLVFEDTSGLPAGRESRFLVGKE